MTQRNPAGPVPTLSQLQRSTPWVWLTCGNHHCRRHRPAALAPFVIRWGGEASSDKLRRSTKCSRCGHVGVMTFLPSYVDATTGFQIFPAEQMGD